MENRGKKQEEKITKYESIRWELKQQFPGYDIQQYNIIIHVHVHVDVLGGWSNEVDQAMRELFDARGGKILLRMQMSRHVAHPEHYPHTESDVLRIVEEWTETFLVILVYLLYITVYIIRSTQQKANRYL